jgi:hypothetical protein
MTVSVVSMAIFLQKRGCLPIGFGVARDVVASVAEYPMPVLDGQDRKLLSLDPSRAA